MTKHPNKKYKRIIVYLTEEAKPQVDKAAADAQMTDSAWIVSLIENALGVNFGMRQQKPHGSKRGKQETE